MINIVFIACMISADPGYTGAVLLTADNCGACKRMEPAIVRMIVEGRPIIVVKVKTQEQLRKYGAEYVPTLLIYEAGRQTEKIVGYREEKQIRGVLSK